MRNHQTNCSQKEEQYFKNRTCQGVRSIVNWLQKPASSRRPVALDSMARSRYGAAGGRRYLPVARRRLCYLLLLFLLLRKRVRAVASIATNLRCSHGYYRLRACKIDRSKRFRIMTSQREGQEGPVLPGCERKCFWYPRVGYRSLGPDLNGSLENYAYGTAKYFGIQIFKS